MSEQKAFDTVVKALLEQNCKSLDDQTQIPHCMYRGHGGTKCAIGHLIPNSMYRAGIESASAESLRVINGVLCVSPTDQSIEDAGQSFHEYLGVSRAFLGSLQSIHDTVPVIQWPRHFAELANKYGLKYNA